MQSQSKLNDFYVESKLGEGSFSCVYKVKRIDDGKYYAMKKVKIGQMREKERENALNEVRILASISHPNIVNYREAFFDDRSQTLCIVMELADAGDIQKKINEHLRHGTHFNETEIWQALVQQCRGLKALHEINILHRDLKCANVFITSDRVYKLGDLNVSKVAKRGMARTQTGTPYYTSPEVWNDRPYDAKCDLWSLGCVIYEMATLRPPFRAGNLKQLYAKIQRGIYEQLPSFYSQDLKTIVALCLKVNPSHRPSASQLLRHVCVTRNTPATEVHQQNNSQTSKASLLKTIIVPKNLKGLKGALPGSKYEGQKIAQLPKEEGKFRRANSANQLRSNVPQVIESPKMGSNNNPVLKYAFMRRQSQEARPEPHSQEVRVQPVRRIQRNNSVDYVRRRVESNQSLENSNRRDRSRDGSKEILKPVKEIPRPSSREGRYMVRPSSRDNSREIERNNSRELVRPVSRENRVSSRQIRASSRQMVRNNSRDQLSNRDRANSRDASRERARGMEEISNRCKEIENRMKLIMEKKKEMKEQRSPNLPFIQPNNLQKEQPNRYHYQRPVSRDNSLSRNRSIEAARRDYGSNKSIEVAKNDSYNSNRSRQDSKRSLDRPVSRERVGSLDRGRSRQSERRRYGVVRHNY